jgi:hypothetical protein
VVVSDVVKLITDMQQVGSMHYLAIGGAVTRVHPHDSEKVRILPPLVNSAHVEKFLVGRILGHGSSERSSTDHA